MTNEQKEAVLELLMDWYNVSDSLICATSTSIDSDIEALDKELDEWRKRLLLEAEDIT